MKRRLLSALLTMIFVLVTIFSSYGITAEAYMATSNNTLSIIIDGKTVNLSNYAIYTGIDGRLMYPLRLIAEELGAEVTWDSTTKRAGIISSGDEIWLTPTTGAVLKNGVSKQLKYNIEIKDSHTYVPVEFISEILGVRAIIDSNTKAINIQSPLNGLEAMSLSDSEKTTKDALNSYLTSLELNGDFSGQILISLEDKVLIDRSYGYSDIENKIRNLNTTTFAIGSVTKQFTAAAIVKLAEENKLSLQDKVSNYIDGLPFADEITIHQLLTHTSGLYNYTNNLMDFLGTKTWELSFEEIISVIDDKPLDFEPGSNWSYSNTGYLVLGEIVERLSGKSLIEYLEDNVFTVAAMTQSGIAFDATGKLVEANGYSGNIPDDGDEILLNVAYGAGYLTSTVQDLYKWNSALLAGEIVSLEGVSKLFGKDPEMDLLVPYSYGWMMNNGKLGEEILHGGNTFGFTSLNTILTEKAGQIIILTNRGYVNLDALKGKILDILNGESVALIEEIEYIEVSEELLNKYEGNYEIKDLLKFKVSSKDGKLTLQGEGQMEFPLDAISETEFIAKDLAIAVKFDSKENPTEFILYQSGQQFRAVRFEGEGNSEALSYIDVSVEVLEKYAGAYEIKNILKIDIFVKNGRLFFQGENQPSIQLDAISETEFIVAAAGISIKFDSREAPTEFILYQAGFEFTAERIE